MALRDKFFFFFRTWESSGFLETSFISDDTDQSFSDYNPETTKLGKTHMCIEHFLRNETRKISQWNEHERYSYHLLSLAIPYAFNKYSMDFIKSSSLIFNQK